MKHDMINKAMLINDIVSTISLVSSAAIIKLFIIFSEVYIDKIQFFIALLLITKIIYLPVNKLSKIIFKL